MSHPDAYTMPRPDLEAHAATGCELCALALRFQDDLDRMIASSDRTLEAAHGATEAFGRLERTLRAEACVHHYVMVEGGMACRKCGRRL